MLMVIYMFRLPEGRRGKPGNLPKWNHFAEIGEDLAEKNTFSFYSKTSQMHQCLNCILFAVTLHMFRKVFPSIARSSRLCIQQQAYVKHTC